MLKLKDKENAFLICGDKPRIRIGRDEENDIIIADESVSGFHAEIIIESGRMEINDLDSTNGTWHNNSPVEGRIWLKPGDILRFGRKVLEVVDTIDRPFCAVRSSGQAFSTITASQVDYSNKETGKVIALFVSRSEEQGTSRIEIKGNMTVGRMQGSDIFLDIPTVSDNHAQIIALDGRLEVVDLGSTNGTFVNDHRVRHQALSNGDRVRFDESEYIVEVPKFLDKAPINNETVVIETPYEHVSTTDSNLLGHNSSVAAGYKSINKPSKINDDEKRYSKERHPVGSIKMRIWYIYQKDGAEPEIVKKGFNWWAFFFVGIWALFKGLLTAGIVGISVSIAIHMPMIDEVFALFVAIGMMLLYGFKGNSWVSAKLEKDGFVIVDKIEAASKEGAKTKFSMSS